jgi:hypothetical protein
MSMKCGRKSLFVCLVLLPAPGYAQRDTANLPLVEMPSYPKDADLVLQPQDPKDRFRVFVDRSSVSVEGKETRLVYLIETQNGVRNVFLEGFRCAGRTYTTYAIGSGQGVWQRIETPSWQAVTKTAVGDPRARLLDDGYLCGRFWEQLPAREVARRLGRVIETTPP